eukprot:CAMPEP_0115044522 /NCGR_PEP_ID=MMETSP0216-20121206/47552_1 /TAXON_ID=223996 /ORGANISM="Protocruzia adherens, Strain Boccale" /LENGTH=414 /DNA_ID=CAMNT_0002427125 /DNA_START=301 /DNA_END=1545 /DNA_ORIENTATION=-
MTQHHTSMSMVAGETSALMTNERSPKADSSNDLGRTSLSTPMIRLSHSELQTGQKLEPQEGIPIGLRSSKSAEEYKHFRDVNSSRIFATLRASRQASLGTITNARLIDSSIFTETNIPSPSFGVGHRTPRKSLGMDIVFTPRLPGASSSKALNSSSGLPIPDTLVDGIKASIQEAVTKPQRRNAPSMTFSLGKTDGESWNESPRLKVNEGNLLTPETVLTKEGSPQSTLRRDIRSKTDCDGKKNDKLPQIRISTSMKGSSKDHLSNMSNQQTLVSDYTFGGHMVTLTAGDEMTHKRHSRTASRGLESLLDQFDPESLRNSQRIASWDFFNEIDDESSKMKKETKRKSYEACNRENGDGFKVPTLNLIAPDSDRSHPERLISGRRCPQGRTEEDQEEEKEERCNSSLQSDRHMTQ